MLIYFEAVGIVQWFHCVFATGCVQYVFCAIFCMCNVDYLNCTVMIVETFMCAASEFNINFPTRTIKKCHIILCYVFFYGFVKC